MILLKAAIVSILVCCHNCYGQSLDTIPLTAEPTHVIGFRTSNYSLLDTIYLDEQSEVYDNQNWYGVYQTRWVIERQEQASSSPQKIGLTRTEGGRKYFVNFIDFDGPHQGVLYDTDLSEGDTVWTLSPERFLEEEPPLRLTIVDEVDYIDCSFADNIKRLAVTTFYDYSTDTVSTLYSHYWYEGLGDVFHPYLPTTCVDGNGPCEMLPLHYEVMLNGRWHDAADWNCQMSTTSSPAIPTKGASVSVYPNPASTTASINLSPPENNAVTSFKLFTTTGRLLLNQSDSLFGFTQVNLSSLQLSPGIYYAVTRLRTGQKEVHRLIVQ